MIHIACCLKSKDSYYIIKSQVAKFDFIDFDEYIIDFNMLKEKTIFNDYDYVIIDDKLNWLDDAIELFSEEKIKYIIFQGDYNYIFRFIKNLNPNPNNEDYDEINYDYKHLDNTNIENDEVTQIENEVNKENEVSNHYSELIDNILNVLKNTSDTTDDDKNNSDEQNSECVNSEDNNNEDGNIESDKEVESIDDTTQKHVVEEKEEVKEKTKEKIFLTNISSKLIIVANLSEGAGSTLISTNLAKNLSNYNLLINYIEVPLNPYVFDLIGIDNLMQKNNSDEDLSLEFYSYPHAIYEKKNILFKKETVLDNIAWLVPDPRKPIIQNWDYNMMMKLLFYARKEPFTILDCGNYFEHESVNNIIGNADLILVVIDPLPVECMKNSRKLDMFKKLKAEGYPIEFVINKFNKEIDNKILMEFLNIEPLTYIPAIDMKYIYKASYENHIPYEYKEVSDILYKPFSSITKKLLPSDIIKNVNKRETKGKLIHNILGKFRRIKINE